MKVFIVDDSQEKIKQISRCLCEFDSIEILDIDTASNSLDAKKKLIENYYDLLIIDINLPADLRSEPDKEEGIRFLQYISINEDIKLPMHIVGITAYEDVLQYSIAEFSKKMWSVIHFDPTVNAWEKQLKEKVSYLVKLTGRKSATEKFTIGIITAVDVESKSVFELPIEWVRFSVPDDPVVYYRGDLKIDGDSNKSFSIVTASTLRMGMVATATLASNMSHHFQPDYLVMVGVCAGVSGKTNFGDVIIGDPIWSYESGKHVKDEKGARFLPSPHQVNLDVGLRAQLQDLIAHDSFIQDIYDGWSGVFPSDDHFKVHLAPISSGSSVIADSDLVDPILGQHRQVLGVEMEGYGLMVAAECTRAKKPIALVIKSVCDHADEAKDDDWQPYAAYTSSNYFYHLFCNLLDD